LKNSKFLENVKNKGAVQKAKIYGENYGIVKRIYRCEDRSLQSLIKIIDAISFQMVKGFCIEGNCVKSDSKIGGKYVVGPFNWTLFRRSQVVFRMG
jgi:hypothetical protein